MGIKDFSKLIREYAPGACQTLRLADFAGQTLAVDVSNFAYQFAYNQANKKPNNHLAGFFQMVYELAKANITPLMILDGKAIAHKDHIMAQRQDTKDKKLQRIAEMEADQTVTTQAVDQVKKQIIELSAEMWQEIRQLFQLLGVPTLQAPGEADVLASYLTQTGQVAGIISEDMDHLVFGATTLIRDFNNKRNPDLQVYKLPNLMAETELNHQQLVDLAILCGCDYTPKITGIAWKRAYQFVQSNTIEEIMQKINSKEKGFTKFKIPADFQPQNARQAFLETDETVKALQVPKPQAMEVETLRQLLMTKCNYRQNTLDPKFQIIEALKKL